MIRHALLCLSITLFAIACDDTSPSGDDTRSTANRDTSNGGDDVPVTPVPVEGGAYTYALDESTGALSLWTTPAARKVLPADRAPEATGSGLAMSAARRELETTQLILGPGSGDVTVSATPFAGLGAGHRLELAVARYDSGWPDALDPLESGGTLTLDGSRGTPLYITVVVPEDAPAGEHTTTLSLSLDGSTVEVPLTLYVFDFAIPAASPFATQMNINISSLVGSGSVDDAKTLLFEHRLTPKSVPWPSGFNPGITWERGDSPCAPPLWDEPDEGADYSIRHLARKYILGEGWNGVGFPTSMLFQFVDNATPRPNTFCGIDRGSHEGSDAYNAEWSEFLGALQTYLTDAGMLEKTYIYVQNEPQDAADHALAAHLCRLYKAAAPNIRIAISEEPKPEIAEDPGGACGYDIWIAHVGAYQQEYAWARQRDHGEAVWLYSLDQDPDPFFNPTRADVQGMHARIIPWVSWTLRVTGFAYYDAGRFFPNNRPGIRAIMLREGIEDYAYLFLAAGGTHPQVFETYGVDETVAGVASSLTSWSSDPDALMTLRHELGLYLEGSRETLPVLETDNDTRPRGAYHLNFQDPSGSPAADPLEVDGETWMKIGWGAWDESLGYGWSGENVGNTDITLSGYDDVAGFSEVEKSYLYDDYGRLNRFEFALANGRYAVTLGVGRPRRGYPGDPYNAVVEGQVVVDDEATSDAEPTITRTVEIDLKDGSLSLEVGGRSEATGNFAYTFVQYLSIEPIE